MLQNIGGVLGIKYPREQFFIKKNNMSVCNFKNNEIFIMFSYLIALIWHESQRTLSDYFKTLSTEQSQGLLKIYTEWLKKEMILT